MIALPQEYLSYLGSGGLKEGCLAAGPGWFRLWGADEVLVKNLAFGVQEVAPGFIAFGSSGGSQVYAFDEMHRVVVLRLTELAKAPPKPLSASWSEFVRLIEVTNAAATDGHQVPAPWAKQSQGRFRSGF